MRYTREMKLKSISRHAGGQADGEEEERSDAVTNTTATMFDGYESVTDWQGRIAAALMERERENKCLRRALSAMWFAYENKDTDYPHDFETEAVAEAEALLGPWREAMKLLRDGARCVCRA